MTQTTWAWCHRCRTWQQVKYGGVTLALPPDPTRMPPFRPVIFRLHNSRPYFECLGSNMPVDPDRMVDTPVGSGPPPTPLTEVLRDPTRA